MPIPRPERSRPRAVLGALCWAALLVVAAPALAQEGGAPDPASMPEGAPRAAVDPVIAIINDLPIRRSEVLEAARGVPEQYRQLPLEMIYPPLLERMIDIKLVAAKGRDADLQDDETVRRRVAELTERVIQEVYLTRYVEERITEQGLRQRYAAFLETNPPTRELRLGHILLGNAARAEEVVDRLRAGEDFGTVAAETSIGPEAAVGGDMGFIAQRADLPDFVRPAFALREGDLTATPVRSSFGFHVLKVLEERTLPPPGFDEARDLLVLEWSQEIIGDLLAELRDDAEIQRFDFAPGDDASGGPLLGDSFRAAAPIDPEADAEPVPALIPLEPAE